MKGEVAVVGNNASTVLSIILPASVTSHAADSLPVNELKAGTWLTLHLTAPPLPFMFELHFISFNVWKNEN